jgi:membrane associated rhomboid family serine protease/TolA-binding protein
MPLGINLAPLPVRTDRTLRAVPYVTYTLCFLCVFVYLGTTRMSLSEQVLFERHWGFIINAPSLVTLITHGFVHTDLFHLLGNVLILWLVGTVLETGIGSIVFLLFYLAGQVAAILLYWAIGRAFLPNSLDLPLIGASGAIAGVTGLATFRYPRLRVQTLLLVSFPFFSLPLPIPYLIWLPLWSYSLLFAGRELITGLLNITDRASDPVAHWAHIGGLGLGVIVALLLQSAREGRREGVLEDSAKAAAGLVPQSETRKQVRRLLETAPDDPEALEAMAGMTLSNGERERSQQLYLAAIPRFLAAGLRDRAAVAYLNVLRNFPDAVLPPRELMAVGSALEVMGNFPDAKAAFLAVRRQHPRSDEAQTALLRAAQILQRYMASPQGARELLNSLLTDYPDSHLLTIARERLRTLDETGR